MLIIQKICFNWLSALFRSVFLSELIPETIHLNAALILILSFFFRLVALVVFQANCQISGPAKKNTHTHTPTPLMLSVSIPVFSSNQCWRTARCGTLSQLEGSHTSVLTPNARVLCCFPLFWPAACQSCGAHAVSRHELSASHPDASLILGERELFQESHLIVTFK